MAVKIRLMRVGKRKQPSYRVVVADGRAPRDGRYIEIIGQYGPREEPSLVSIDDDKALAWLRKGAQPTDIVLKLLTETGVWERYMTERNKKVAPLPSGPKRTEPKLSKKAQARAAAASAPASGDAPAATTAESPDGAAAQDKPGDSDAGGDTDSSADGSSNGSEETTE